MNLRKILPIVVLTVALQSYGQAVTTDFDKKIICPDSLNLPRNTSALTVLSILPELLQRPGGYILNNYDVQINDMTVGSATDVALSQLQVMDIEKIEVSESPVDNYNKNGQGGTINFVLASKAKDDTSLWGSVGALVTSDVDVAPRLNLAYRKGKFMIHGLVLGEVFDAYSESQTQTYVNGNFLNNIYARTDTKFQTELARAYMNYDFTSRDKLSFNVSEIYTHQDTKTVTDFQDNAPNPQHHKGLNLHTLLKYERTTARNAFTAQFEYMYQPSDNEYNVGSGYLFNGSATNNNLSGKLEDKAMIFNRTSKSGMHQFGELTVGCNFNGALGSETTSVVDHTLSLSPITMDRPRNNTFYVMPYITYNTQYGPLMLKATAEMQHFQYRMNYSDNPYTSKRNDFTAKLMAEWHFTPERYLRLMLDRKLDRPGYSQIYPFPVFDLNRMEYVKGNPELTPMLAHEVSLDYFDTFRWADSHRLTLNAGVGHNRTSDIINGFYPIVTPPIGQLGQALKYYTYKNNGHSHITNANLMAHYSYRMFSLSLVGNVYHKMSYEGDGHNHYTYFNIAIHPYFNLKDGWSGGARLTYYSRVDQADGSLGDCAVAKMTVGKAWKNLFIYLTENVTINKHSKDITNTGNKRTEKMHQAVSNAIGLGVRYSF